MHLRLPLSLAFAGLALALVPEPAVGQELVVRADAGCVRTGIPVRRGQKVMLSAIGTATYGQEGAPVNARPVTTPMGERFLDRIPAGVAPKDRPIDGLFPIGPKFDRNALLPGPIGALVGRVGAHGRFFYVGAQQAVRMPATGTLYLCYNDVAGAFGDNTGSYRVVVTR